MLRWRGLLGDRGGVEAEGGLEGIGAMFRRMEGLLRQMEELLRQIEGVLR